MSMFTMRSWKPFDSELNSSCWVEVYSLAATTKSKKQTASSHPAFPLSSHLLFPNSFVMCISLWAHSRLANSCLTNQCSGQMESTLKPSFKRNECLSLAWWEHIQNIPWGESQRLLGHLSVGSHTVLNLFQGGRWERCSGPSVKLASQIWCWSVLWKLFHPIIFQKNMWFCSGLFPRSPPGWLHISQSHFGCTKGELTSWRCLLLSPLKRKLVLQ